VRLPDAVRADIVAHAREEAPNECCGLLIGRGSAIHESVRARNLLASPTRYLLDPAVHIAANRSLRGSARAVIGVYHSHPRSPAVPSARDLGEALYPEFIWLIVSLAAPGSPEVAAYRMHDGAATPIPVLVPHSP
jgi:proteasome lid subunit RPN8/RPN11